MMQYTIHLVLIAAILPMLASWSPRVAQVQNPETGWAPFVNISHSSTSSTYPCIAADAEGNVHVIWSEDVGGKTRNMLFNTDGSPLLDSRGIQVNNLNETGNTLYYTRWNGEKWLDPIDIQVNSVGLVQYPQAVVDLYGVIHLIWVASEGRQAKLFYSQALANKADSAQAWSKPIALVESILFAYYPADIVADSSGGLHVIFSQIGAAPGTYVINSKNGGRTWSTPIELFRTYDTMGDQEGVSPTELMIDKEGVLHATWTRFGSDGNGKNIYYSQSQDSGQTWTKPFEVAAWQPGWYEVDWLSAGVVGKEIHVVWEGSSDIAALNERISPDGGLTWGEARQILANVRGENGFTDLVVDSANQLHLLVVQRGDANAITQGVWHTVWESDHWQDPILIGTTNIGLYSQLTRLSTSSLTDTMRGILSGNGLRYQRTALVNGNELFVVVVNEWDGEIWGTHTTLTSPRIDPQPYPQLVVTPTRSSMVTPQPSPTATALPVVSSNATMSAQGTDVGGPVFAGSFAVLVLMVGVGIYVAVVRRTRN
jgi:hypothetical protein